MLHRSFVCRKADTIGTAAAPGHIGDGKTFAVSVDDAVRIRTGARGIDAI